MNKIPRYYNKFLKALLIMIVFILTSCSEIGTQCFPDPDFGTGAIPKSKTIVIAPGDGWVDTGILVAKDAPATITADGIISFAKTQYSPSTFTYVTKCQPATKQPDNQPPNSKFLVHWLCNGPNTKPDDYETRCENLSELTSTCDEKNTICDTGIKYKQYNGAWVKSADSCDANLICHQPLSSNDYQICTVNRDANDPPNTNPNGSDYLEKHLTCVAGSKCTFQNGKIVNLTPKSLNDNNNEVLADMQFSYPGDTKPGFLFAGDIVTINIDSPAKDNPAKVGPNSPSPSYDAGYNVFVSDVSSAKTLPPQCIPPISYYSSDGSGQSCLHKCRDSSDKSDPAQPQSCFWNACGYGLRIKLVQDGGECPTKPDSSIDFTDTNNDPSLGYAVFINAQDTDNSYHATTSNPFITPTKENHVATTRQFIVPTYKAKLCAWFDGYDKSKVGLGGYQAKITVQSLIAINGRRSSDQIPIPVGALFYRLDNNTSQQVFLKETSINNKNINKPSDPISSGSSSLQKLYLNIMLEDDKSATTGQYTVKIDYFELIGDSAPISNVIEDAATFITNIIYGNDKTEPKTSGIMKDYFKSLSDPNGIGLNYINYIRILLVLYIVIYALTMLAGYTQISAMDLLIRVIKIAIVLALISDASWTFFHDYFFKLFMDGAHEIVRLTSLHPDSSHNMFAFVDNIFHVIFTPTTWLKILALVFAHPLALLIVALLLIGMAYFLFGIYSAFVAYLLCVLATAILIALAPIFIPCCLFSFTSKLFENWWKLLVRYSLEPVLLILGLQIIVQIFYVSIIQLLNFTACWKCAWPINLTFSPLLQLFNDMQVAPFICIPFFGVHSVFSGEGGMSFSNNLHIPIASGIIATIMAFAVRGYDTMVTQMIEFILEERPGSKKGGAAAPPLTHQAPFHGAVGKAEGAVKGFVDKKARSGLGIRTKEELKQADDLEQELVKRKGLRMFGIDANKSNIDDILDGNPHKGIQGLKEEHKDLVKNLSGDNGDAKRDEAALGLGKAFFSKLNQDEATYKAFVAGLHKLNRYEGKLPSYAQHLQEVLQTPEAARYLKDLSSKNALVQQNAQMHVGNAMFRNNDVAKALLHGQEPRREIIDVVLKLGREQLEK